MIRALIETEPKTQEEYRDAAGSKVRHTRYHPFKTPTSR